MGYRERKGDFFWEKRNIGTCQQNWKENSQSNGKMVYWRKRTIPYNQGKTFINGHQKEEKIREIIKKGGGKGNKKEEEGKEDHPDQTKTVLFSHRGG